MEQSILKVAAVATVHSEKTNSDYIRVTFKPVQFLPNGTEFYFTDKSASRIYSIGKEPQLGDLFGGEIRQFNTTPYEVNGNPITKFSCVILTGEHPYEVVNALLRKNNAVALYADGKQSAELPELVSDDTISE